MRFVTMRSVSVIAALAGALPAQAQVDLSWYTYDSGGGVSTGGGIELLGVIGQADAGRSAAGAIECLGGFLGGGSSATPCYANCDGSTVPPVANVADFICFQNQYAAADSRANCDASTLPPVLNVADFICFLNAFAAGCP